jgi:hypothetical protein
LIEDVRRREPTFLTLQRGHVSSSAHRLAGGHGSKLTTGLANASQRPRRYQTNRNLINPTIINSSKGCMTRWIGKSAVHTGAFTYQEAPKTGDSGEKTFVV